MYEMIQRTTWLYRLLLEKNKCHDIFNNSFSEKDQQKLDYNWLHVAVATDSLCLLKWQKSTDIVWVFSLFKSFLIQSNMVFM